ncbi:MAG TPA: SDR family oxidoreductase [Solirubrobacteraceae bacterium]|nr:SDR family oxidoreductase [Solirubrobacteraceae bacterium]
MTGAGRRALVTGGSRGIGLAVAQALATRGWRLALLARDAARIESAVSSLPGAGHEGFALDVSDPDAWSGLAGSLDDVEGVVCAAGVLEPVGPIGTYSSEDFRRTLDVNVLGTLLAIEACLPSLRERGGAVATFGGGGATSPLPGFDAYATSKAAVVRLTENIAASLAADGVSVNCVAPGFVATEIHQATLAAGPGLAGEEYFASTRAQLEGGGVPASEAAELVCLLLDRGGVSFTGRLISAQWDPWREDAFRLRLASEPDLGTLRRIDGMFFVTKEHVGT